MACAAQGGSGTYTFCDGAMGFLEGEVLSTVCPLTLMGWLAQPIRVSVYYYYSLTQLASKPSKVPDRHRPP
jgi:hypothetical protein